MSGIVHFDPDGVGAGLEMTFQIHGKGKIAIIASSSQFIVYKYPCIAIDSVET